MHGRHTIQRPVRTTVSPSGRRGVAADSWAGTTTLILLAFLAILAQYLLP